MNGFVSKTAENERQEEGEKEVHQEGIKKRWQELMKEGRKKQKGMQDHVNT